MEFLLDQLRFLGLNEKEVKVFTALSTFGRMNMTTLAKRSDLARTTVDAIVRRLVEQGLVIPERVGGHAEYSVCLEKVADRLVWLEKRLRPGISEGTSSTCDDNNVKKTEPADLKTIEKTFSEHERERVRILLAHSRAGMDASITRLASYVDYAIRARTKLEVLVCAKVADRMHEVPPDIALPDEPDLVRLNLVPVTYCSVESDTLIFRDVVLMLDTNSGTVRAVHDSATVDTMKHLLDVACETGWSVNLAAWLERV